jgi:hypothetical protein
MLSERYLELVKSVLLNETCIELEAQLLLSVLTSAQGMVLDLQDFRSARHDDEFLAQLLTAKQMGETVILETADGRVRGVGEDLRNFTEFGLTLVGRKRLDHLQTCMETVIEEGVPGDFLEAGVWRGGCSIFMRAFLEAHDCRDRNVWLADSFAGLPVSDAPEDLGFEMDPSMLPILAVPEHEVARNFERFGLLDEQVRFLPGWFEDSLPASRTGSLALLRVDCDLYDSTLCVLDHLYGRVSPGGWVVIDDYGILPPCRQAVDGFRKRESVNETMSAIDDHAVAWRVGIE